jgi:hypothetical protein
MGSRAVSFHRVKSVESHSIQKGVAASSIQGKARLYKSFPSINSVPRMQKQFSFVNGRHRPLMQASRASHDFHTIHSCHQAKQIQEKAPLTELLHKLAVELLDPADPLGTRRQESRPEVERALLLSESTTRNNADAGSLKQAHAVELVGALAGALRGVDGLLRECDAREEVHGACGRGA